jgi:hypothetical protein
VMVVRWAGGGFGESEWFERKEKIEEEKVKE